MAAKEKEVKVRKFPARGTIGHLVLTELAKNPNITTEALLPKVKAIRPDSKFSASHLAWYKHQVKNGRFVMPKGEAAPKKGQGKKQPASK